MSEGIQLLPSPSPGWEWVVHEVAIGNQVFFAMLQERQPEPPVWWEAAYSEADYGHLLWLLTLLAMGARKIRDAWKGKKD